MHELILFKRKLKISGLRMSFNLKAIIVVAICSFVCTADQDVNGNTQCVNSLIEWCSSREKSPNFLGNFLTTDYSSSGERQIVHCIAGTGGLNCTLNNNLWFACHPDGTVLYKNNVLRENNPASDDGVCEAAKKAKNMFTYNSAEVQAAMNAGRKAYNNAMRNVHNTMDKLNQKLNRPCFPFCNNNPFGRGFPFN